MIDHEEQMYDLVSGKLREAFPDIFVTWRQLENMPESFPMVVFYQLDNTVLENMSTFDEVENANRETYQIDVYSNLAVGREKEIKSILKVINEVMAEEFYVRTFDQPIPTYNSTIAKRVARYVKETTY